MAFIPLDFMGQYKPFFESYPEEDLVVDYLAVDGRNRNHPEGSAINLAGSNINRNMKNVIGETRLYEQINTTLILRRFVSGNPERRNAGNFILNYLRWVNWCQAMRDKYDFDPPLPTFGIDGQDVLLAQGGFINIANVEPGQNVDEFIINVSHAFVTENG